MKNTSKNILALCAVSLSLCLLSACGNTQDSERWEKNQSAASTVNTVEDKAYMDLTTAEKVMPTPFSSGLDVCGDENSCFYQPCNRVLDDIPVELLRLRDENEVGDWISSFPSIENAPSDITEYANVYSFITSFDIAKDEAESALSVYLDSDDDQIRIAREEFDTVFSGDKSAVTKEFASDYSIVINDKVYCPNWIYTHSVSDYYEAGISAEEIDSKVTLYSVFGFTDEAREAFEDKLSVYLNKRVGITPKVQQNTYDTDYLQYDIYEDELEDVFDDSLVIDDVVEIIDD